MTVIEHCCIQSLFLLPFYESNKPCEAECEKTVILLQVNMTHSCFIKAEVCHYLNIKYFVISHFSMNSQYK